MHVFEDRQRIREILTGPDIWGLILNGATASPDDFALPDNWLYLTETGNEVFVLSHSHQIHANILPKTRHKAYWMCKKFINWINENTELNRIYLKIHKKHKNAIMLGKMCGFEQIDFCDDRYMFKLEFDK